MGRTNIFGEIVEMSIRIVKTGLVAASRRGYALNPIRYNLIQPSRSFSDLSDLSDLLDLLEAANAEQSEQNEGEVTIEQENETLKKQFEEECYFSDCLVIGVTVLLFIGILLVCFLVGIAK